MKKVGSVVLKTAIIVALSLMVILGLFAGSANRSKAGTHVGKEKHDFVSEDGKTTADFFEPVYRESRKEAKLDVFEQDVYAPGEVTQEGLFKLPVFQRYQSITYKATVQYFVDFGSLQEKDISVDNKTKTVTVTIPKPTYQIVLKYGEFEFEETKTNSFLPAPKLKLTLEEVQELEKDAANKIDEKVKGDADLEQTAENAGIEKVTELLQTAVSGVDKDYQLVVTY